MFPRQDQETGDHELECNVKSEIKTCSDRTGAVLGLFFI